MKITADANIPYVKDAFSGFGEVSTLKGRDISRENLTDTDVLLVRSVTKVNRKLIEGTPVKFVGSATIGVDHIDQEYLKESEIGFSSAPGCNAVSVAEYVTAALLNIMEKSGKEPQDLVLGIVGVGNVGSQVEKRTEILGFRCLCCDPFRAEKEKDFKHVDFSELTPECDIITMHVPLTRENRYPTFQIADEKFFDSMKNCASFINTSRGDVVKESALKRARKKLDSLVLDVWSNEPDIDTELMDMTDIATPHIAGYSFDGKVNGTIMLYQAVKEYFSKDAKWSYSDILDIREKMPQNRGSLLSAVLHACPLPEDDRLLRSIKDRSENERGAFFDSLRKNYRKRLEFCHYDISGERFSEKEWDILVSLGFNVK